jgi:transglutaminase-like putative cysteine protease
MNYRLTITSAVAVVLASFSLITVIDGLGWLYAGIGAAVVVALAGLATRQSPIPAAAVATVLTLIVVAPLIATPTWAARLSAAGLVGLVAASAGVRRVLPALADVVTYLAALLVYLTLVFARTEAFAWLVPTVKSLRQLGHLVSQGYAEHQYAPPVPSIRGIELLAAGGIGLVAVLTDLLAVRLNSPAVAGLPLLVLFSVPVATNVKHVGFGLTLSFCLGITGYLALLAADGRQRLRLWGRLVTVWQNDDDDDETSRGPDTRQLAASGRRVGLAAVAFAIVLPLILPGLKEHGIFGGKSTGSGHGAVKVAPPQPLVQMRGQLFDQSPSPVLTYHTTAADPREQYLRLYVLNYDGGSGAWKLVNPGPTSRVSAQQLAAPPGLDARTSFSSAQTTVTMSKDAGYKSSLSYLPVPYAPQYLRVPGSDWVETKSTLMVFGYRPDAGLTYTVTSRTPQVIQSQLPTKAKLPASVRQYLLYPGPDRQKLLAVARSITQGARTPFAKALALQNWFTSPGRFTYTLKGSLTSSVYDFVTTERRGFCQQFAFSMAVMSRLLGIPARIAVGYTAGTRAGHNAWKVTTADAHAWPELYFPTVGWTRFEPTPGGPTAQGTAEKPNYPSIPPIVAPPGQVSAGPSNPVTGQGTGTGGSRNNLPHNLIGPNAQGNGAGAKLGPGFPVGIVVAIVAGVLLIAPGTTRLLTRRRRWLAAAGDGGRAHAAWRELTSDLTDYGLSVPPSESPRAVSRRIGVTSGLDDPAREAIGRISAAEERARYARTPADGASLQADVLTVRRAVARNSSRKQRWRARLFPPSTLAPVLAALRQAPDIFGWLDAAGLRIRRMVLSKGTRSEA